MNPSSKKILPLLFLGLLLILSFYTRFNIILSTDLLLPLQDDAAEYYSYAYNLRHHQIYSRDFAGIEGNAANIEPDALRNPGYPLFLFGFVGGAPTDRTFNLIVFAQVLISTFTVAIVYFLYKRYLQSGWAGLAAILTAVCPHLVIMNIYLLSETLFCFGLCVVAWAFSRLSEQLVWPRALILGAVMGLANLVRPSLLFFPFLLSIFILWQVKNRRRGQLVSMVIIGFAIVMAPWYIRNLATVGRWSDDRLQVSFLHHGMYPDFIYNGLNESYSVPYRQDPRSAEIGQNTATVLKEIIDRFRHQPVDYVIWYLVNKPKAFWSWDIVQGQGDVFVYPVSKTPYWDQPVFSVSHRLMRIVHEPLVLLGLIGCVMAWFPSSARLIGTVGVATARFTSLLLVYYTALHMIGFPEPRYAVPLRPFLYGMGLFAAGLIWTCVKCRWTARNSQPLSAAQGD